MFKHKSYTAIIRFFLTLAFIDKLIEIIYESILHDKREKYIPKYLNKYTEKYPNLPLDNLEEKLNDEADRVYDIVDRSILRERVKRGKYVFWLSAIAAIVLIGSLGGFKSGSFVPFIAPIITAIIGWAGTVLTIPISYNQRVKGGLDSVITRHRKLQEKISSTSQIKQGLSPLDRPLNTAPIISQVDPNVVEPICGEVMIDMGSDIAERELKLVIEDEPGLHLGGCQI